MADYKVVNTTQLDSDLTSVADAIRAKGGTSAGLAFPAGFVNAISAISTGSNTPASSQHFATDIVTVSTAGQRLTVSNIRDAQTGEAFTPRAVAGFICPTTTTNYTSTGSKPAVVAFYRNDAIGDCAAIAAYNTAYSTRIHTDTLKDGKNDEKDYTELVIDGNSFTYYELPAGMYGLMAARWRWIAWD